MDNGIQITLNCAAGYGYHFLSSGLPLIHFVSLFSQEEREEELLLELRFVPELFTPLEIKLCGLRKGQTLLCPKLPSEAPGVLLGETGKSLRIEAGLKDAEQVLSEASASVPLYAYDEFIGGDAFLTLSAALVTPEAGEVKRLWEKNGWKSIGGYHKTSREELRRLTQSLYQGLREENVTYSIHPFVAEKKEQRLCLAADCLRKKSGNAAEIALLFASLAESLGLDCALIWFSSAVYLSVSLCAREQVHSRILSREQILEAVAGGEILLFDPSDVCYGSKVPFAISEKTALTALENGEGFLGGVEIAKARREGVKSVPVELYEKNGDFNAKELLAGDELRGETEPLQRLREELLLSSEARQLLSLECVSRKEPLGEDGTLHLSAEEEEGLCLGVGRVEYFDRALSENRVSYLLLSPLVPLGECLYKEEGKRILNTVLLERLAQLFGWYPSSLAECYSKEGEEAFLREAVQSVTESGELRVFAEAMGVGAFSPDPCLWLDSLRCFHYSEKEPSPVEIADTWTAEPDSAEAVREALNQRLSLIRCEAGEARDRVITELAVQALSRGLSVSFVSSEPKRLEERIRAASLWQKEGEENVEQEGEYFRQVFRMGAQGFSFFQTQLMTQKFKEAPEAAVIPSVLVAGLDREGVALWSRAVGDLADAADRAGGIPGNPLKNVKNPAYSREHEEQSAQACDGFLEALEKHLRAGNEAAELLRLPPVEDRDGVERLMELIGILTGGEWVERHYYEHRCAQLGELISTGKKYAAVYGQLMQRFERELFRLDADALLSEARSVKKGFGLKKKAGRKAALAALRACCAEGKTVESTELEAVLDALRLCKALESYLGKNALLIKECFGVDLSSPDCDPIALWERLGALSQKGEAVVRAYGRIKGACEEELVFVGALSDGIPRLSRCGKTLKETKERLELQRETLANCLTLELSSEAPFSRLREEVETLREGIGGLEPWTAWLRERSRCLGLGLSAVVEQCESGRFGKEEIKKNFLLGFFLCLGEHLRSSLPALASYDPEAERELWKRSEAKADADFALLCEKALSTGALSALGLRQALCSDRKERVDLMILDEGECLSAAAGAGLLELGERTVILASSLKRCRGNGVAELALRLGAKERFLRRCDGVDPDGARTAAAFAEDLGLFSPVSGYPLTRVGAYARLIRVHGGYDEATQTNIIEATVAVDELLRAMEESEDRVCVLCLGEAQRRLVTLLLARRLASRREWKERYLSHREHYRVCTFGEELPSCEQLVVSLCFSCAEQKYSAGLSYRLADALGENCAASLHRVFTAAKKSLKVIHAFSMEELDHTRCATEQMRVFRQFAARLFAMPQCAADPFFTEDPCRRMVEKLASALRENGYPVRRNCGFSSVKAELLVCDPQKEERVIAAVLSDRALRRSCSRAGREGAYVFGLEEQGILVLRLSSVAWFEQEGAVIDGMLKELAAVVPPEDAILRELAHPVSE